MARHTYQVQTIDGLARKASSVANCSGAKRSHRPVWASRNVGTPDSADIPAPDNTTTELALATRSVARCIADAISTTPARRREQCLGDAHRHHRKVES